jgi:hypothetical protein
VWSVLVREDVLTMHRQSKKRKKQRRASPAVWVNPEIRKLLWPSTAELSYSEVRQAGFAAALLRAQSEAHSSEKA